MARSCRDCGIADWQPCICTDAADLEDERRSALDEAENAPCAACDAAPGMPHHPWCELNRSR